MCYIEFGHITDKLIYESTIVYMSDDLIISLGGKLYLVEIDKLTVKKIYWSTNDLWLELIRNMYRR